MLSSAADERRGKIESQLAEQIREVERERDESIKAINDLKELQILSEQQYRELNELLAAGRFQGGHGRRGGPPLHSEPHRSR